MKPWKSLIVAAFLAVCLWVPSFAGERQSNEATADKALQTMVDALPVRITTLDEIERLFGKPEQINQGMTYRSPSNGKPRAIYKAEYPSNGLSFTLFTNPSQLYAITITARSVAVHGLRIGDPLEQVKQMLNDEGRWRTTDSIDYWWLDFETLGVRYGFDRNRYLEKYPMSLSEPASVTSIEVYDRLAVYGRDFIY